MKDLIQNGGNEKRIYLYGITIETTLDFMINRNYLSMWYNHSQLMIKNSIVCDSINYVWWKKREEEQIPCEFHFERDVVIRLSCTACIQFLWYDVKGRMKFHINIRNMHVAYYKLNATTDIVSHDYSENLLPYESNKAITYQCQSWGKTNSHQIWMRVHRVDSNSKSSMQSLLRESKIYFRHFTP